jgi:hypothetical protein
MLLILLAAGSAAAVTLRGPADVASLTAAADAVVRAQVVRQQSAWADPGPQSGLIFTTVELQALEWWKGAPSGTVLVRVPGGAVGDLGQLAQGAARFDDGEEVVLFLRRGPSVYEVERWGLGKFTVRADQAGAAVARRSREGLSCQGCRPGEPDQLSLDELRARVLAAAKGQAR